MNQNVLPQCKALPQSPNPPTFPLHDNAPSGQIRCLMEYEWGKGEIPPVMIPNGALERL
jgi:hypothetical protein